MFLKSPTEKPVQVAILSGHCIVVGPEGREVPQDMRMEAFRVGCIPMDVSAADVAPSAGPAPGKDHKQLIVDGIKKMLEDNCELTGAGMPNLKDLSKVVGFNVSKIELGEAWVALEKETSEPLEGGSF